MHIARSDKGFLYLFGKRAVGQVGQSFLLDSHVFVWVKTAPQNLSDKAREAIVDPDNDVFVSLASAWEGTSRS